jgi:hypothetical protein
MSESPVESQAELPVRVLLVGAQHPAARPLAEALAAAVGCAAVRVTESAPQDWLRAGGPIEYFESRPGLLTQGVPQDPLAPHREPSCILSR